MKKKLKKRERNNIIKMGNEKRMALFGDYGNARAPSVDEVATIGLH